MRESIFDTVFSRVMSSEGGFQNDPKDRANWTSGEVGRGELKGTKYGISAMSYPNEDIENLTFGKAKRIYQADWWEKLGMDRFNRSVVFQIFDAAVNHGFGATAKMVQKAAGVAPDGIIGKATLAAIDKIGEEDFLLLFLAERIEFFTRIKTFDNYGRGWMNRIAANLRYATEDN